MLAIHLLSPFKSRVRCPELDSSSSPLWLKLGMPPQKFLKRAYWYKFSRVFLLHKPDRFAGLRVPAGG